MRTIISLTGFIVLIISLIMFYTNNHFDIALGLFFGAIVCALVSENQ